MSVPYPTLTDLQQSFTDLLDPITRWRIPPPSEGDPVRVNQDGVDHWVGHVGAVRLDADKRAHSYVASWPDAGRAGRGRVVAAGSVLFWGFQLTIGGGDPRRVRWALDRIRPIVDGARLQLPEGHLAAPLGEVFGEGVPIQEDDDVSPPRWYTTVRYATSAH